MGLDNLIIDKITENFASLHCHIFLPNKYLNIGKIKQATPKV